MTVPVSHAVRSNILAAVEAQETPPNLFAQALKEVLDYMENNQFPRFAVFRSFVCDGVRFLISPYASQLKDCIQDEADKTFEDSYSSTVVDAVSAKLGDILYNFYVWRFYVDAGRSLRDVLHYPVATRFFKTFCERSYDVLC